MRTKSRVMLGWVAAFAVAVGILGCSHTPVDSVVPEPPTVIGETFQLPPPASSSVSLEQAIDTRHSVRSFADQPLPVDQLAALLWAGYGFRSDGGRTVPSAGGLYSLRLFVVANNVDNLAPGVYVWDPDTNELGPMRAGDFSSNLQAAALNQTSVGEAPLVVVIAGSPARLVDRYGERAEQYTFNEAGHSAQNVLLMAAALDLGAVAVGGFDEDAVAEVLSLPEGENPYYLIPIGTPAD